MKYLTNILPFIILLACPLMHIFMMRDLHKNKKEHKHDVKDSIQHEDRKSIGWSNAFSIYLSWPKCCTLCFCTCLRRRCFWVYLNSWCMAFHVFPIVTCIYWASDYVFCGHIKHLRFYYSKILSAYAILLCIFLKEIKKIILT